MPEVKKWLQLSISSPSALGERSILNLNPDNNRSLVILVQKIQTIIALLSSFYTTARKRASSWNKSVRGILHGISVDWAYIRLSIFASCICPRILLRERLRRPGSTRVLLLPPVPTVSRVDDHDYYYIYHTISGILYCLYLHDCRCQCCWISCC